MKNIPKSIQHLFWDIDVVTFNPRDYPEYTISRVLEFGDEETAMLMNGLFYEAKIKEVIKSDKKLSPKSASFWAIMFDIPLGEIIALTKNGRSTL